MTPVGSRLHAFARRVCAPDTMERVVDPLIADLQHEYASAARAGRAWRARRHRLAGYAAFWTTLAVCAVRTAGRGIRGWTMADERAMGRTLGYSAATIAALVFLLALMSFYAVTHASRVAPYEFGRLYLYLVPQAIPVAMAFGLPLGILVGLRGRSANRRIRWSVLVLCLACAAAAFFICGWVLPETNQAFREAVVGPGRAPARGANELTFGELTARLAVLRRTGSPADATPFVYSFHARLAASTAPIIWGIFALALASMTRRTLLSIAIVVVAGITYIASAAFVINSSTGTYFLIPLAYVIWLPNALFALMTIALRVAWRET